MSFSEDEEWNSETMKTTVVSKLLIGKAFTSVKTLTVS